MGFHPVLPNHRPLAIAHRWGNSIQLAREAIDEGFDLIEADVWPFRGRLEVRHVKSLGPIPVYWERWYVESIGGRHLRLPDLVAALPLEAPLFLDVKGSRQWAGERAIQAMEEVQPGRQVVVCGRDWSQLEPLEGLANVHVFYSVGSEEELAKVWRKLELQRYPAISIHHALLSDETFQRLTDLGTTVIAWTVNDPVVAADLVRRGVDGLTSDNVELLKRIVRRRELAFEDVP